MSSLYAPSFDRCRSLSMKLLLIWRPVCSRCSFTCMPNLCFKFNILSLTFSSPWRLRQKFVWDMTPCSFIGLYKCLLCSPTLKMGNDVFQTLEAHAPDYRMANILSHASESKRRGPVIRKYSSYSRVVVFECRSADRLPVFTLLSTVTIFFWGGG
jgi:hypothetical protein